MFVKIFIKGLVFLSTMKVPKEMKRYCPKCRKHTSHKVKHEKNRGRNKAHPLSKYSTTRLSMRGIGVGFGTGNKGRLSRGAMNSWKQYNKKQSKKVDLRFTCSQCKKISVPGAGKQLRTKRISVE